MAPRLSGYVKIHRKLIEWGWYQDHAVKDVFLHLLITASYKESEWMGYKIKPGQVIVGSSQMARDLGLSRQQVRTALIKLESTGEITKASTNRFTIVTVENWAEYQIIEDEATNKQPALSAENELSENFFGKNQPAVRVETPIHTGVHATNKQPTSNQQATNKQPHLKKVKNIKNNTIVPLGTITAKDILELYHLTLPSLPKVRLLTEARKKALNARKATLKTWDDWREYFQAVSGSAFLLGANDRNWRADFDWLTKESNMAKVLEGKYESGKDIKPGEKEREIKIL